MCLLTFIPDYVTPDMDRFAVAAQANPDGFGFAILDGNRFVTAHSMSFSEVANKFTDLRTKHQGPAIFHFRWATHGTETVENCHPFRIGDDPTSMMGHNGILPVVMDKTESRSDTRLFAEDIFPAVGGITSLDDDEYFKRLEKWATGSKLVFLTSHPDAKFNWYILNENDGHWDKDMWWSNYSYERRVYTPSYGSYGYGSYSSGWSMYGSGWDDDIVVVSNGSTLVPDYDDEADLYVEDLGDRYEECLDRARVFTTHVGNGAEFIECYNCCHSYYAEKSEWQMYCPECMQCLFCGMTDCDCWEAVYEMDAYMEDNGCRDKETAS